MLRKLNKPALVAGAIASSASKDNKNKDRRRYCLSRYGNYDERSHTYRASDGRSYPLRVTIT